MKTGSLRKITTNTSVQVGTLAPVPLLTGGKKAAKAPSTTTWQEGKIVALHDVRVGGENNFERLACVEIDGRHEWRSTANDEFLQVSGAIAPPRTVNKKRKR